MDNVEKGPAPQEMGDKGERDGCQRSSPAETGPEVSEAVYVPTSELSERQVGDACASAMEYEHQAYESGTHAVIDSAWCRYEPWRNPVQAWALAERFPKIAMEVFAIVYRARNTSDGTIGNLRELIYKEPMRLLAHTIASRWRSESGRRTLG